MENLMRGRKIFEPPRFMTVNQCCQQLIEVEHKRQLGPSRRRELERTY